MKRKIAMFLMIMLFCGSLIFSIKPVKASGEQRVILKTGNENAYVHGSGPVYLSFSAPSYWEFSNLWAGTVMPYACVIKDIHVYVTANTLNSNCVIEIMKSGAVTNLGVTVTPGQTGIIYEHDSFSCNQHQHICVKVNSLATTGAINIQSVVVYADPTATEDWFLYAGNKNTLTYGNPDVFQSFSMPNHWEFNESWARTPILMYSWLKKICVLITQNSLNGITDIFILKDGQTCNLGIQVNPGQTGILYQNAPEPVYMDYEDMVNVLVRVRGTQGSINIVCIILEIDPGPWFNPGQIVTGNKNAFIFTGCMSISTPNKWYSSETWARSPTPLTITIAYLGVFIPKNTNGALYVYLKINGVIKSSIYIDWYATGRYGEYYGGTVNENDMISIDFELGFGSEETSTQFSSIEITYST